MKTLSVGQLAEQVFLATGRPIQTWQIIRLVQRGFLPEPPRVATSRAWPESDLPKIIEALQKAGYLRQVASHV